MDAKKAIKSSVLRLGRKTFFFDVKETSSNKRYLKITESLFEGEGKPAKRNYFVLFPEEVTNFQSTVNGITSFLNEQSAAATVAA